MIAVTVNVHVGLALPNDAPSDQDDLPNVVSRLALNDEALMRRFASTTDPAVDDQLMR